MASQSVTLMHALTQSHRTLRIGGTLIASNWADHATIYTVPVGKRLVLKGGEELLPTIYVADTVELSNFAGTAVATTLVLSAGTIIKTTGNGGFIASGFLEDDV
jgi:hypothetical protein